MSLGVQELFQAALALSNDEQGQLVDLLTSTLAERKPVLGDDASSAEVAQRSADDDAGVVGPLPRAEVKSRAGQELTSIGPSAIGPVPPLAATRALRPFGLARGEFIVPDNFDAPLPDDLLEAFEG